MHKRMMQAYAKHVILDSAKENEPDERPVLDAAEESLKHSNQELSRKAIRAFLSLSEIEEEGDYDEDLGDALKAMLASIASSDNSGDEINLSEEDEDQIDICRAALGEYLEHAGCDIKDIKSVLNDFDNDATERCLSEINSTLDDGDDAVLDSVDSFVFSTLDCTMIEAHMSLDEIAFDAVYKKKRAIVNGVKKWVNKRVSGVVKLSAKMKRHLKKLSKKVRTSASKRKFKKSMKMRKSFA